MVVNDFGRDYGVYRMHTIFERSLLIACSPGNHMVLTKRREAQRSERGGLFCSR